MDCLGDVSNVLSVAPGTRGLEACSFQSRVVQKSRSSTSGSGGPASKRQRTLTSAKPLPSKIWDDDDSGSDDLLSNLTISHQDRGGDGSGRSDDLGLPLMKRQPNNKKSLPSKIWDEDDDLSGYDSEYVSLAFSSQKSEALSKQQSSFVEIDDPSLEDVDEQKLATVCGIFPSLPRNQIISALVACGGALDKTVLHLSSPWRPCHSLSSWAIADVLGSHWTGQEGERQSFREPAFCGLANLQHRTLTNSRCTCVYFYFFAYINKTDRRGNVGVFWTSTRLQRSFWKASNPQHMMNWLR